MVLISEVADEPEVSGEDHEKIVPERPRGGLNDEPAAASTSGRAPDAEEAAKERGVAKPDSEALKNRGNDAYKAGDWDAAAELYTQAIEAAGGAEQGQSGKLYHQVVDDCSACLKLRPDYVKALLRRAEAYRALGELDFLEKALADATRAAELDPGNKAAAQLAAELRPVIAERQEKLKEEMVGKLKDLGNMVLGKFGLSLNNFKAEQDPQTGSYSIQFVQQPGAGAAAGAEATSREVGPPPVGEEPPGSEDPDY